MMKIDDLPWRIGSGQLLLQPLTLRRILRAGRVVDVIEVRLARIGIQRKELHRALAECVVILVAGKGEVIDIRLSVGSIPIVISEAGEEVIDAISAACAKRAFIGRDE